MKTLAALVGAVVLAAGSAQALGTGNVDHDMPSAPVVAQNSIEVEAAQVLSSAELARVGVEADTTLMVSDFTAPGERSTYIR